MTNRFPPHIKERMIRDARAKRDLGKPIRWIAADMNIPESTLSQWLREPEKSVEESQPEKFVPQVGQFVRIVKGLFASDNGKVGYFHKIDADGHYVVRVDGATYWAREIEPVLASLVEDPANTEPTDSLASIAASLKELVELERQSFEWLKKS